MSFAWRGELDPKKLDQDLGGEPLSQGEDLGQGKQFTAVQGEDRAGSDQRSTTQEIGSIYGVHPTQVTTWKKQLDTEAAEIFTRGGVYDKEAIEEEKGELYEQIGRLQMELTGFKKSPGSYDASSAMQATAA